jgi:uncharacterized protein (TIGR03118 family)
MYRAALKIFAAFFVCSLMTTVIRAQANSFTQTNLVSDTPGLASVTDPNLINPWGISFFPGNPFWISDNKSGLSTLYDAQGHIQPLVVTIPPPNGASGLGTPTGTVVNGTQGFQVTAGGTTGPSVFLFDSEDGTISGWNGNGTNAVIAVDNSMGGAGAVYKGMAFITNGTGSFILVTNFRAATVEAYDANFKLTQLAGTFTDPTIPAGFAPYGIKAIGSQVFVTYALQDTPKHNSVNAPGNGYVSVFDLNGNFVQRIASTGTLNSPWGLVIAPASFGAFGGDLLVGNFGDGTINAFDPASGAFKGQLEDANGTVLVNGSLWDMVFGAGGTGDPNTMYFTAGLADEQHGLFASLVANATPPPPAADFTVAASPQSATIPAGGSASFTISLGPLNGFSTATQLSCSGLPALATCSFTPSSVTPQGSSASTSTLTISTKPAGYMPPAAFRPMGMGVLVPLATFGLFGMVFAGHKRKGKFSRTLARNTFVVASGMFLAAVVTLAMTGCGGYSANTTGGTPTGASTVMVTATSGSITHSTSIAVTVQ